MSYTREKKTLKVNYAKTHKLREHSCRQIVFATLYRGASKTEFQCNRGFGQLLV